MPEELSVGVIPQVWQMVLVVTGGTELGMTFLLLSGRWMKS